jgi:1,4-alpha-glucan branching enzyme
MPPLLFMGEEWGSSRPFPFFCDFTGTLADAVRNGRREEFKEAYAALGDGIPDPLAHDTFRAAVLDWEARATPTGRARLELVRDLLAIRRREITPNLAGTTFGSASCKRGTLTANWPLSGGKRLNLLANLSPEPADLPRHFIAGRSIWGGSPAGGKLPPWSVFWSIGPG